MSHRGRPSALFYSQELPLIGFNNKNNNLYKKWSNLVLFLLEGYPMTSFHLYIVIYDMLQETFVFEHYRSNIPCSSSLLHTWCSYAMPKFLYAESSFKDMEIFYQSLVKQIPSNHRLSVTALVSTTLQNQSATTATQDPSTEVPTPRPTQYLQPSMPVIQIHIFGVTE
jgi:hypothetical protein